MPVKMTKKSYSHFKADDLAELGLEVVQDYVFTHIEPQTPSNWLIETFAFNQQIPMISEKARSELLITPILLEMRRRNPHSFTFFSGCSLNVDAGRGLKGVCDFILATPWNAMFLQTPLLAIVEAKHNQSLLDAVPQCSAEMLAAQLFNQRKNIEIETLYGVITNGYEWLFLTLNDNLITADINHYHIHQLSELLGIWQFIINDFNCKE
jgi:hypothetical protein